MVKFSILFLCETVFQLFNILFIEFEEEDGEREREKVEITCKYSLIPISMCMQRDIDE